MIIASVLICLCVLVLLISWQKMNTFIAFLLVSILAGVLFGMPFASIIKSINKGVGDTLSSVVIVIVSGAMLGKLVAESGAAQCIANWMQKLFGGRYITFGMALTGFIVGIPLYYNVGFILLIPIIFSVAYNYKLPRVYVGLPMLTALSVMHGFLPPHPSPMTLVGTFNADITKTFMYGLILSVPAIIIAGPMFSATLKNMRSGVARPAGGGYPQPGQAPGIVNSLLSSLMPVLIIGAGHALVAIGGNASRLADVGRALSDPIAAMLLTLLIASWSIGTKLGRSGKAVMDCYSSSVKDVAMILLIIGGAGALKEVFVTSSLSTELTTMLEGCPIHPLLLAWLITAGLRLCLGSATVAGLTAAGVLYPIAQRTVVDPNLLVLAIGAGSLFGSHVNDTAFWLYKEYFQLNMKQTFKSWTVMESAVSVIGLLGILLLERGLNI